MGGYNLNYMGGLGRGIAKFETGLSNLAKLSPKTKKQKKAWGLSSAVEHLGSGSISSIAPCPITKYVCEQHFRLLKIISKYLER